MGNVSGRIEEAPALYLRDQTRREFMRSFCSYVLLLTLAMMSLAGSFNRRTACHKCP